MSRQHLGLTTKFPSQGMSWPRWRFIHLPSESPFCEFLFYLNISLKFYIKIDYNTYPKFCFSNFGLNRLIERYALKTLKMCHQNKSKKVYNNNNQNKFKKSLYNAFYIVDLSINSLSDEVR